MEEVEEVPQESDVHAPLTGVHIQGDAGGQGHLLISQVLGMLGGVRLHPIQHPIYGRVAHDDEPIGQIAATCVDVLVIGGWR